MDMIGTTNIVRMLEVKREDVVWAKVPAGLYSINATGTGIGGIADNFGFVQQEMTGNVTATLHLEKVFRRNKNTKGGLMIRSSHTMDASHVSILVDVDYTHGLPHCQWWSHQEQVHWSLGGGY